MVKQMGHFITNYINTIPTNTPPLHWPHIKKPIPEKAANLQN